MLIAVIASLSYSRASFILLFLFSWCICVAQSVVCALAEVISMRFLNGIGPRPGIMGIDYSTAVWLYRYVNLILRTEFLDLKSGTCAEEFSIHLYIRFNLKDNYLGSSCFFSGVWTLGCIGFTLHQIMIKWLNLI